MDDTLADILVQAAGLRTIRSDGGIVEDVAFRVQEDV